MASHARRVAPKDATKTIVPRKPRNSGYKDADIGARVRAMRVSLGLSQEELAKGLQVSLQQVQKYEKGTNRVSGVRILMLAELLQTSPLEILGWKSDIKHAVAFDAETYKLAEAFAGLKPALKSALRHLIDSIADG